MNHEATQRLQFNASQEIGTPEIRRQISKEFQSARESLEMTIEQVSAITKINQRFLKNIEDGRWSFLPPSYIKLFIRAYAEVVDIDTDSFNTRLENLFRPIFKTQLVSSEEGNDFPERPAASFVTWTGRNRSIVIYSAVILVVLVSIVIYQITGDEKPEQAVMPGASGILEAVPEDINADANSMEIEPVIPEPVKPLVEEVPITMLNVLANDTCYFKVQHLDSVLYERTLWPGNSLDRELPLPLMLKIGNAPGLRVISNGDTLMAFPEGKRYRTLKITDAN